MSTGGSWPGISSDVNPYLIDLDTGNLDLAKPTESNRRVSGIGTPKPAAITDKRVPSPFPTQGHEVKVNKRINWLKNTGAKRFVAAIIGACAKLMVMVAIAWSWSWSCTCPEASAAWLQELSPCGPSRTGGHATLRQRSRGNISKPPLRLLWKLLFILSYLAIDTVKIQEYDESCKRITVFPDSLMMAINPRPLIFLMTRS